MLPTSQGAFRFFKLFGIQVSVHWSWFLVAYYQFQRGKTEYHNPVWMALEYLALFGIVLLHEFGHSLACRSVGGRSDQIILWPFGGIAFVQPPHRPGAVLWSIAAGPLVNVVLVPVLMAINYLVFHGSVPISNDAEMFFKMVFRINLGLLIFNILPIYPLDGGQILQSILWFFLGYAKSLLIAGGIGLLAGAALAFYGFSTGEYWLGLIALFILSQAWRGFQSALQIQKLEREQRRDGVIDV